MEYLALYRKYRPKELDEVVGQSEIKKILASSVKNGTITHAYLFSGPRGTGKTTMAKILAKMVNCSNPVDGNACNKCDSCLNILNSNDVIEIDAASNNGVDEIRDLREKANLVPTSAKYKVYIIDEVHMLTTQAFNALLKTLEEPPKHVIFILATTEYYKIPLTITSRCQKFQFNKITNDDIVKRLKEIASFENIIIDDDALYEIAKISDGGMRDSINFLDQLRSVNSDKITINDVYDVCGNVSIREINELFLNIKNNNVEKVTDFFEKMNVNGKNYNKFFEDLICFLKDVILFKNNVSDKYIKFDISYVKNVSELYSLSDLFYMSDKINCLMDKLKNISRQSVIVIANFLLMMNDLNKVNIGENKEVISDISVDRDNYEMAFNFTSDDSDVDSKLTDNDLHVENDNFDNSNNFVDMNKDNIINNTFAVANKEIKKSLQDKFSSIDNYLTDKKFSSIAGILLDTVIQVAGNGYIIFSAKYDSVIQKVYNNYKLCNELINIVFDNEYTFVVISNDEWEKYRNEYINNLKSGKKYFVKDINKIDIIDIDKKNSEKELTIVDKLFDLVGEDVVEFK